MDRSQIIKLLENSKKKLAMARTMAMYEGVPYGEESEESQKLLDIIRDLDLQFETAPKAKKAHRLIYTRPTDKAYPRNLHENVTDYLRQYKNYPPNAFFPRHVYPLPDRFTIVGPFLYSRYEVLDQSKEHTTNICIFGERHEKVEINHALGELSIVDFVRSLALTRRVLFLHENLFFFARDRMRHRRDTVYDKNYDRGKVFQLIADGFEAEIADPEKNSNPRIEQIDPRHTDIMHHMQRLIYRLANAGFLSTDIEATLEWLVSSWPESEPIRMPSLDPHIVSILQAEWLIYPDRLNYIQNRKENHLNPLPIFDTMEEAMASPAYISDADISRTDHWKSTQLASVALMKYLMDLYAISRIKEAVNENFDTIVFYCGAGHTHCASVFIEEFYNTSAKNIFPPLLDDYDNLWRLQNSGRSVEVTRF